MLHTMLCTIYTLSLTNYISNSMNCRILWIVPFYEWSFLWTVFLWMVSNSRRHHGLHALVKQVGQWSVIGTWTWCGFYWVCNQWQYGAYFDNLKILIWKVDPKKTTFTFEKYTHVRIVLSMMLPIHFYYNPTIFIIHNSFCTVLILLQLLQP